MSDGNRKSIMDFVARSQAQFAERRKQQQQQQQQGGEGGGQNQNQLVLSSSSAASALSAGGGEQKQQQQQPTLGQRTALLKSWTSKIEDFVNDGSQTRLELPSLLSGFDRRELHSLATKFNLSHSSVGFGTQRHLVLSKDALFYRAAAAGILNHPDGTAEGGGSESGSAVAVQSRGQARRERQEARANQNEKDLYADRNAIKGFRKFQQVLDPLARAVDTVAAPGDDVENDHDDDENENQRNNNNNRDEDEDFDDDEYENANRNKKSSSSFVSAVPSEKNQNQQQSSKMVAQRRDRENDQQQQEGNTNNDQEEDGGEKGETTEEEEENHNNNSNNFIIPDSDFMTVEQICDAAQLNEISDQDVEWIREFSTQASKEEEKEHSGDGNKTERVLFCIDFGDFISSSAVLSRARASSAGNKVCIIQISAADSSSSLKSTFSKITTEILPLGSSSMVAKTLCLCLPGTPLFGEPLNIAIGCALSKDQLSAKQQSALAELGASVEVI